eukprot:364682-Chlamydomonas_euryale.AAC.28
MNCMCERQHKISATQRDQATARASSSLAGRRAELQGPLPAEHLADLTADVKMGQQQLTSMLLSSSGLLMAPRPHLAVLVERGGADAPQLPARQQRLQQDRRVHNAAPLLRVGARHGVDVIDEEDVPAHMTEHMHAHTHRHMQSMPSAYSNNKRAQSLCRGPCKTRLAAVCCKVRCGFTSDELCERLEVASGERPARRALPRTKVLCTAPLHARSCMADDLLHVLPRTMLFLCPGLLSSPENLRYCALSGRAAPTRRQSTAMLSMRPITSYPLTG